MGWLLFGLVWLLNLGISVWNAYAAGKSWVEARVAGGWPRLLCSCGAVLSASGFSWCYLILLTLLAHRFEWIGDTQLAASLNLGYLMLIPGILLSGLMITLDSWARAFRRGGFLNYGVAAYNTYAQVHNTYRVVTSLGDAFRSVSDYFGGGGRSERGRDRDTGWVVVVLLVAAALAAGVLTSVFIIWRAAATTPLPPQPSPEQFVERARGVERVPR